ncbi:MAG: Fur family transcriptional regulator [Rhodobacterales bacterium]|nr:MAG: Fur family transcriptional regulator [Rhodobacterales bacterium]PIE12319.1 MAG: Fur family transcriptional regulator [Rhodobacterales bacterium]
MQNQTPAFHRHDHGACSRAALQFAEAHCAAGGARLTPVRRRTLEILLEEHRAMGAYEVLERLRQDGFGHQPPVAYRALDFLVDQGLAHRVRRLNAFTACTHPQEAHAPAFLICEHCGNVAEMAGGAVFAALDAAATQLGFAIRRTSIEATGRCPNCAGEPSDAD